MKSRGRPAAAPYHHGNLREALLDAGRKLLAEGGPEALSLREVARRAGVSHAAPYRHFDSKDALMTAIAEDGFRALADELEASAKKAKDPLTRFQRMGVGYVRFALAHPAEIRNMFAHTPDDPASTPPSFAEVAARAFDLLVGAVADCQAAGKITGTDPLPPALAAWSLVHGVALLSLQNAFGGVGTDDDDALGLAEQVVRTMIDGLRPR